DPTSTGSRTPSVKICYKRAIDRDGQISMSQLHRLALSLGAGQRTSALSRLPDQRVTHRIQND
ncbi:MAG: hypothetical protein ABJA50_09475, partial [Chloroflexota bacterium]